MRPKYACNLLFSFADDVVFQTEHSLFPLGVRCVLSGREANPLVTPCRLHVEEGDERLNLSAPLNVEAWFQLRVAPNLVLQTSHCWNYTMIC